MWNQLHLMRLNVKQTLLLKPYKYLLPKKFNHFGFYLHCLQLMLLSSCLNPRLYLILYLKEHSLITFNVK